MALVATTPKALADSDPAFYRVDCRTPPHELPRGVAADAMNKRFEDGRAWPRLGTSLGPWGKPPVVGNVCGYSRFSDPDGIDTAVVVTDDWRNGAGEDGGRGRAYRIVAGNVPLQIPMNGHDIYGVSRIIPCLNAVVLIRQGNERHYFGAAAIAGSEIQLNSGQAWNDGDQVFLWGDVNAAFTAGANPPALNNIVYVKGAGGNKVKLYADPFLVNQYMFTAAIGRFYLERQAVVPGFFGNGAPPLMAQADSTGATIWDAGFKDVPANLQVVSANNATGVWTVNNHRLIPGDEIKLTGIAGAETPANGNYYVNPITDHTLQLFDNLTDALYAASNGGTTGLEAITITVASTPVISKVGASGLSMPPAREGYYTSVGRLVLVNLDNTIMISDPLDPLHYTPMQETFTATVGENDQVTGVAELASAGALIITKRNSILALLNFSQTPTYWSLISITREYGCIAPLTMTQWGPRLLFLSRRGVDSVTFNAFGNLLPGDKPLSYDMKKYVDLIDWNNAGQAVMDNWNNRLFLAYPTQGQPGGAVQNNAILSLNFLNTDWNQGVIGWEGQWTGVPLKIYGLARLQVFGEQRMTFVNYAGQICWFDDGCVDVGNLPVQDSLTTRRYTGQSSERKIWQKAAIVWDTNNPTLTVTAISPGWNEQQVLATNLQYNRGIYEAGPNQTYNPQAQVPPFNTPFREDYSLAGASELIGGQPDVLQNLTESFRLRVDDWGVQFVISNTSGCCKINSVIVSGFFGPGASNRTV